MTNSRSWLPITLIALSVLAIPSLAAADLVRPQCSAAPVTALAAGEVVELVLSTLLRKGVAVLLLGATSVVSLPWLVAGMAAAVLYVPQRLKAWW